MTQYISISWIYWALCIAYGITILSIIGVVISENRNPVKSLAWVTVLLVVPAVGLVLYILFGRSIKNKRFISRRNRRRLKRHEPGKAFTQGKSGLTFESGQQIKLGQSLMGSPYYLENGARIYINGTDKFKDFFEDIRQASKFIYLQYYIFEDDKIGTALADLLIEKARQGVKVKVIYDHVGCFRVKNSFYKRMRESGIEIHPFFKVKFPFLGTRINWRNHRKIALIDGIVGYIGGMNIADRYIDGGKFPRWRDTHMRITGPILRSLNHSFSADWNFMGRPLPEEFSPDDPKPSPQNLGMQFVTSGPTGQWGNISMLFLKAIGNARKSIFIQTPYFLPTEALFSALQAAALSKVDVRIMIPRRSDSDLLRYASFSYITESLRAGIKFYLYDEGMLHSKVIIIDDEFATVGSTNFDFRSFEHNFESNLFIYSREFNSRMTQVFLDDVAHSTRILPYEWKKRPFHHKIKESLSRLLAPIL